MWRGSPCSSPTLPRTAAAGRALGEAWRARFGRYYPAMALVEVSGLMDEGAMVEIEATAVLGGGR